MHCKPQETLGYIPDSATHPTMKVITMRLLVCTVVLSLGIGGCAAGAQSQATTATGQHAKKRAHKRANAGVAGTAVEAPPAGEAQTSAAAAQQRAADQRLLQQQQAASAQAQQVNDQQVKAAQKQHDQLQNEQRIQDAPGLTQTGVVPAAGAPVAPMNGDHRIQDAPGPAQTLPPVQSAPSQLPAPQTTPNSAPPQL